MTKKHSLKKCPYCAKEIEDKAMVCIHCRNKIADAPPWLNLAGGVLSILLGIFIWRLGGKPNYNPNPGGWLLGGMFRWVWLAFLSLFGLSLISKVFIRRK